MIEINKKCYVRYEDEDPAGSYDGWAIVTRFVSGVDGEFYEVTTLNDNTEHVWFPAAAVTPTKPKPKVTTRNPIFMEDVRHLASECIDLCVRQTGMNDDESHDDLYDKFVAALEMHFDCPPYRSHN